MALVSTKDLKKVVMSHHRELSEGLSCIKYRQDANDSLQFSRGSPIYKRIAETSRLFIYGRAKALLYEVQ